MFLGTGIAPNLVLTILTFCLFGIYSDFLFSLFNSLPIPVSDLINSTLIRYGIPVTETSTSMITSVMIGTSNIGVISSLFLIVPLSDSKGRKFTCIYLRSAISFVSSILYVGSAKFHSLELFTLASLIFGLQGPIRMFSTPLFISECAPDKYRGLATLALTVADSASALVMSSITSPNLLGTIDLWSVVCLFLATRIHESPKWLIQQNYMDDAMEAVNFYHGKSKSKNQDDVLYSMVREKNLTSAQKLSFREVYGDDTLREAVKIVFVAYSVMWLSPIAIEGVYTMKIHLDAGITIDQTLMITMVLSILFSPSRLIGTFLIDKLGRRKMLFIAEILVMTKIFLSTSMFSTVFFFGPTFISRIFVITNDVVTDLIHATGAGSIGPLLISELFPPSARTAVGQCMIFLGLFVFIPFSIIFPILESIFPPAFYVPYWIIHPLIFYYLYKYLPETKQKAVCDIIETLDIDVASRRESMVSEGTPLFFRDRAKSFYVRRAVLKIPRKRSRTMDHLKRFKEEYLAQHNPRK
ncbi:unnamed protein product [Caenorhabditis angaria]|uniref:Major facilitator superfamily (MFS) profile domain-containing protein n=1 Tax=Caenorhabditis angaria TaxID=860376 RepID=A0A9P1J2B9_9PELO|nr:unnamed protein product [Caenorhabditis angaria]